MNNTISEDFWTVRAAGGPPKVTPACEQTLREAVEREPRDCGQDFSTWCARTLGLFLLAFCYVSICPRTIRRHLHRMGYRLVRPVAFVASPDPDYAAKLAQLQHWQEQARAGNVVLLYEDEVDLNLLPGVMRCWTRRGSQRKVRTPGKNVKRYGFGAVDFVSGHVELLTSEHKNSASFCLLVQAILRRYASETRRIVLVVDNYRIHSSQITQRGLAPYKDRITPLFLPTYSPHLNVIELLWKHLRRCVTHNHLFESIEALVTAVGRFINRMNSSPSQVLSVIGASQ